MYRKFSLLITFMIVLPTARAGLLDRVKTSTPWTFVKGKAAFCAERLSGAGSVVVTTAGQRARQIRLTRPRVRRQLRELLNGLTPLYDQVREIGTLGKSCGRASARTIATEAGPMVARIVGFEGRLTDFKDGMLLPLLSRVRSIREARDENVAADELTRRLTSLAIFTVEVGFKMPRFLPMAAQASLAGAVGGVTIGLTNDSPTWGPTVATQFAPEPGATLTGTDLSRMLIGEVIGNIKRALTLPDVSLKQRLGEIISMEAILVDWFKNVGATVGWGDVESELAAWRRKQAPRLRLDQCTAVEESPDSISPST